MRHSLGDWGGIGNRSQNEVFIFFVFDRYFIAVEDNKIIALNVPER